MKQIILWITAAVLTVLVSGAANAQQMAGAIDTEKPLTATEQEKIISALIKQLDVNYVFPETAKKAEKELRSLQKKGAYRKITDRAEFAKALNDQLAATVNDKHLRVWYRPRPANDKQNTMTDADREAAVMRFMRRQNLGLPKVEILEGNIGYFKVNGFGPVDKVGETMSGAMTFLSNTDALIVDLRENGGGEPALVQYFVSHFFDGEPIHINDLYFRPDNRTQEFWTVPVKGVKDLNKPVYILTSGKTFSGGEEFAYDMQQLKRATLVGETTGGGANPGDRVDLGSGFGAFIPNGRAINPITKTNWEGVGVKPHIATSAVNALKEAHVLALTEVLKTAYDDESKRYYESQLEVVKNK